MSKQVVLVSDSGGVRGYAYIDVTEEPEARDYEITCIAGCSADSMVGDVYAADKLREYREWVENPGYPDMLRLLDISFRLGAIRGERVLGKIHEILSGANIEDLSIPYTTVATDLTNQQGIWFQEGYLHRVMRAPAAIPSLFIPVTQGSHMLVDDGLLNPLPVVPAVSVHSGLIIAVNLGTTNQKQYHLPAIEHPAALKGYFGNMIESLGHKLSFFHCHDDDNIPPKLSAGAPLHPVPMESGEPVEPQLQQPAAVPQDKDSPKSISSTTVAESSGSTLLLELVNQNSEVIQTSLVQYKIAGYPPDILINVPKRVYRFFGFYKAPELITLGWQIASDTLNRYEEGSA